VALLKAGLGEDLLIVLEADEADLRGERTAATGPVRDAHPGGHQHGHDQEQAEYEDDRQREQPPRRGIATCPRTCSNRHGRPSVVGSVITRGAQRSPRWGPLRTVQPRAASRLAWTESRMASGSEEARVSSWALRSATTSAVPA